MNSFPLRASGVTLTLDEVARLAEAPCPEGLEAARFDGLAPLDEAGPDRIAILTLRSYLDRVSGSRAGALLTTAALAELLAGTTHPPLLVVENPYRALASLLDAFHPEMGTEAEIHPTAVLGRGVRLGDGVRIGPYAVLEADVVIGAGTAIGAHVVIGAGARVGEGGHLHPHAVVYPGSVLGDGVILHAGCCIGVDGFGYVFEEGRHRKVPQTGRAVIGDGVEIGANSAIDRGSIGNSTVGAGAKLDNLVHLGHNVVVGPRSMLAAQSGIAGSTVLGSGVLAGGQAGVGGHLEVGDGVQIAGQAGVIGNVPPGEVVMGFPARPRFEFLRTAAAQRQVPELMKRTRALERRVDGLSGIADETD